MALEVAEGGNPLKFTAVVDFSEAEKSADNFYRRMAQKASQNNANKPVSTVLDESFKKQEEYARRQSDMLNKMSSQYRGLMNEAVSAFNAMDSKTKNLYNTLASLQQQQRNLSNAQKDLASSFRVGSITQQQFIEGSRALAIQQGAIKQRISETTFNIKLQDQAERRSIGSIAEKTARLTQLKKEYNNLSQAQRNNINVGGKISAEYKKVSADVQRLNTQLTGIKGGGQGIGAIFGSLKNIASAMGIAFGTQQLVAFGMELFSIAKQAEGIELRFSKIGDTAGLEKLRTATRGTVSDLELMKQAVRADNFRIPMDVLAKGLEFATRRANETGESVDYLVDSFVRGLGRKSKLILDNLGISAVELNEEIERTGDFATSVGNIMEREMAKSGEAVDTLAEKTNRLSAQWSNLMKTVANALNQFNNPGLIDSKNIEKLTENYKKGFDTIKNGSKEAKEAFIRDSQEQLKAVNKNLRAMTLDSPEFKKLYDQNKGKKSLFKFETPEDFLSKMQKPLVEQQQALQASLNYSRGITKEMEIQERQSKNIFSQSEIEQKLEDANLVYKNSVGDKERAKALKEVRKWQNEYDKTSIKAIDSASKKGAKDTDRLAEQIKKDTERFEDILKQSYEISSKFSNEVVSGDQREINNVIEEWDKLIEKAKEYNDTTKSKNKIDLNALETNKGLDVNDVIERQEKEVEAKRLEEAEKNYKDLLKEFQTYQQKRIELIEKSNKAIADFEAKGEKDRAEYVKQVRDEELKQLQIDQIENNPAFIKAMEDIETSSKSMLVGAYQTGKDTVLSLIDGLSDATESQKNTLRKMFSVFFDKGIKDAKMANFSDISNAVKGFADLTSSALEFSSGLYDGLSSLQNMLNTAGQLANLFEGMFDKAKTKDFFGDLGKGLSYFGALFQVGSVISNLFNSRRQARNEEDQAIIQANNERQLRVTEAITKALQMQLELIQDIYGTKRLEEYQSALRTIENTYESLSNKLSGRYMLTNDGFTNSIIERLNNGETQSQIRKSFSVASKEFYQVEKIFKNLDKYGRVPQLPKDITKARHELIKLQQQIASSAGGIDDNTQKLLDQLEQQIQQFEDTKNKLIEENTGNSFASLLSDVTNLFLSEGQDAGKAWSDGFNKVMENYMMQKFSRDFLQEKMQVWYDMLDDLSEGGITSSERDQLASEWEKIKEQGQQRLDEMKDVLGLTDKDAVSSGSIASEGIARATEEQFSEYLGINRAIWDINKQQLAQLQLTGKSTVDYLGIANGQLVQLNAININTANTVAELQTAVGHLKNIDANLGRRYAG